MLELPALALQINGAFSFGSGGTVLMVLVTIAALYVGRCCCVFRNPCERGAVRFLDRAVQTEAEIPVVCRTGEPPPIIYTREAGSRFHLPGCHHATPKAKAYSPCRVCFPARNCVCSLHTGLRQQVALQELVAPFVNPTVRRMVTGSSHPEVVWLKYHAVLSIGRGVVHQL